MKKILAILVFVLWGTISYAQWNYNVNDIYNANSGNVGIGSGSSFSPVSLLDVAKNTTEPTISVRNVGGGGGSTYRMVSTIAGADWKFKCTSFGGFKIRDEASATDVIQIEKAVSAGTLNALYIKSNGNVGIGTTNPSVKLAVNGKINCREVEVTLTGWSDYVFKDGYNLKPLSEVEAFINDNKHLPGVPSEAEVLQKGTNLGEMDAVLLQKIEELTLYVINLKKQNDNLNAQIQELKQK